MSTLKRKQKDPPGRSNRIRGPTWDRSTPTPLRSGSAAFPGQRPAGLQLSGQVQRICRLPLENRRPGEIQLHRGEARPATVMTITRIEKFVESPEEGNDEFTGEIKQDSGTYLGQIDPHSIEIRISGVPLDKDPRAFQLSGQVQQEFAGYRLKTGDQVKFSYTVEKRGQATMMTITRIENQKPVESRSFPLAPGPVDSANGDCQWGEGYGDRLPTGSDQLGKFGPGVLLYLLQGPKS